MNQKELNILLQKGGEVSVDYSWGETFWKTIYFSVLSNNSNDLKLLRQLSHFLPCVTCKKHYVQYLRKHPIPKQKGRRFEWVVKLEMEIASRKGKKVENRYSSIKVIKDPPQPKSIPQPKSMKLKKKKKKKKKKKNSSGCACGI